MMNALFGYLTPHCANCPDWLDGSNPEQGVGCGTHYPIMWCPHFAEACRIEDEMFRKQKAMENACKKYPCKSQEKNYVLVNKDEATELYLKEDGGLNCFVQYAARFTLDEALIKTRVLTKHFIVQRVD